MPMRLINFGAAIVLGALLTSTAVIARAAEPLSDAQRGTVENIVRDYLLKNPEIIVESLRGYEETHRQASEKEARQAIATSGDELEKDPTSPVVGNQQGDVTLVQFFDYRCGYCKKVVPSIQELLKTDKNIRMVFKEFPILGPDSVTASRAALAAWKIAPDKYLPFHVAMMESRGEMNEARVLEIGKKVGIDVDKLKAAMSDPAIKATIDRNIELARKLQINGTPAFIIGGQLVPGAVDLATLREMVATARAS
jgi:protein-disulfide isomerase